MGRNVDRSKRNLLLATSLLVPVLAGRDANAAGSEPPPIVQLDERSDAAFIGRALAMRRRAIASGDQACPMCEAAAFWAGIERMVSGPAANDGGRPGLCA